MFTKVFLIKCWIQIVRCYSRVKQAIISKRSQLLDLQGYQNNLWRSQPTEVYTVAATKSCQFLDFKLLKNITKLICHFTIKMNIVTVSTRSGSAPWYILKLVKFVSKNVYNFLNLIQHLMVLKQCCDSLNLFWILHIF